MVLRRTSGLRVETPQTRRNREFGRRCYSPPISDNMLRCNVWSFVPSWTRGREPCPRTRWQRGGCAVHVASGWPPGWTPGGLRVETPTVPRRGQACTCPGPPHGLVPGHKRTAPGPPRAWARVPTVPNTGAMIGLKSVCIGASAERGADILCCNTPHCGQVVSLAVAKWPEWCLRCAARWRTVATAPATQVSSQSVRAWLRWRKPKQNARDGSASPATMARNHASGRAPRMVCDVYGRCMPAA